MSVDKSHLTSTRADRPALTENTAFTERAITTLLKRCGKPLTDKFNAALVSYLIRVGRVGIGPGDMLWVKSPSGQYDPLVWLVPRERDDLAA